MFINMILLFVDKSIYVKRENNLLWHGTERVLHFHNVHNIPRLQILGIQVQKKKITGICFPFISDQPL